MSAGDELADNSNAYQTIQSYVSNPGGRNFAVKTKASHYSSNYDHEELYNVSRSQELNSQKRKRIMHQTNPEIERMIEEKKRL